MLLRESFANPPPVSRDYNVRINGPDGGIINAWQAGIALRGSRADLVSAAQAGELPILPYRGGVDRAIKAGVKTGSLHYLAMWQGLRGDDLNIDTNNVPPLICSRYGITVHFTSDTRKLFDDNKKSV
ncbi:MAG: hypothetical protein LBE24_09695 [Methylobacillus sp.]|jgi:hypothetical protein|nr:hypothetical protein [Methylobacillus sp.]